MIRILSLFFVVSCLALGCTGEFPSLEIPTEIPAKSEKESQFKPERAAFEPVSGRDSSEKLEPEVAPDSVSKESPTSPEERSAPKEPPTSPDAANEPIREFLPESLQEVPREQAPERAPAGKTTAVSLLASFLKNHPQSGLMDRVGTSQRWQLTLVIPAGNHQLQFKRNNEKLAYGSSPSSTSTWPVQGKLQASGAAITLSLLRPGRYRVEVDLANLSFVIAQEPIPSSIRIEGNWSGKSGRVQLLKKQSDGTFQVDLQLEKGTLQWRFELQQKGVWKPYGVLYPPRGVFPQGGAVYPNGKKSVADISRDGMYRLIYRPLEHSYTLHPTPVDGPKLYQALLADLQKLSSSAAKTSRINQFLNKTMYAGKLPSVQGTSAIFAVRWKSAKAPVHLAGSFNQWNPTKLPMKHVKGTDFYHIQVTLPVGRHAYKFVDSSAIKQWVEDPSNSAFEFTNLGSNSVVSTEGSAVGELHRHKNFFATQLNNRRTLYVYLPPDYYKNLRWRYPVLYMHDGQNLFNPKAMHGGWDVNGRIRQMTLSGKMPPVIVVGIANTPGRMNEYTHTQDKIGGQLVGGKAKEYADFLLREVKPWIDGQYRTLPSRRQTGTMGSSLGGLISLWLGYSYSDTFFRIGALSSTISWGKFNAKNPTILDIAKQEPPRNLVIYLDSGSPKDNYQSNLLMRDALQQKGYVFSLNLMHWVERGAEHNEKEWRARLFRPLEFLLSWP